MKLYSIVRFAGMLACAGALYISAANAGVETIIHLFAGGSDGASPLAGLIKVDGTLYGTTERGGGTGCKNGCGIVFSVNPRTGAETVLHAFAGGSDGAYPLAGLINVGGTLYGTTERGGSANCAGAKGCGTVFSVSPTTGAVTVLYAFAGGSDGAYPLAGLLNVDGTLYGTTERGGTGCPGNGCGTVFSVSPTTATVTIVYSFTGGRDGAYPHGGLINARGKVYGTTLLYGTTARGGGTGCGNGCGTVYTLDRKTGAERVLHAFAGGRHGAYPLAGLINVEGTLYGTTERGGGAGCGTDGCGTVFSVSSKTGAVAILFAFAGDGDGAHPHGGVLYIRGNFAHGTLYGTTERGGTGCRGSGCGTVFSVSPTTGAETVLYSFDGGDGAYPFAGLINLDGMLSGTTARGGGKSCRSRSCGTVFSVRPLLAD
jgi:uncharacterized repeat protein (TIGR03803 family)